MKLSIQMNPPHLQCHSGTVLQKYSGNFHHNKVFLKTPIFMLLAQHSSLYKLRMPNACMDTTSNTYIPPSFNVPLQCACTHSGYPLFLFYSRYGYGSKSLARCVCLEPGIMRDGHCVMRQKCFRVSEAPSGSH